METSIKSVVLKLNTDKPVRKTPYQVKGVFIRHFKSLLELHEGLQVILIAGDQYVSKNYSQLLAV